MRPSDVQPIPDSNIQFLVVLATQRCEDCGGFTAAAARVGIGKYGEMCTCPFKRHAHE